MKALYILLLLTAQLLTAQSAQVRTNTLSAKAAEAYAIKSESKVNEFYNYIEILSDPRLKQDMKLHTAKEAMKLFQSEGIVIPNIIDKVHRDITLADLLEQISSYKNKLSIKVNFFNSFPETKSDGREDWNLAYEVEINGRLTVTVTQKFHIVLEDKKFGKTVQKVWNTYLGEITVIQ